MTGERKKVIIVVGPTAIGKTAVAAYLAEHLSTKVVVADSQQVYKYLDIAANKPERELRLKFGFYLVDIWEPDVQFTVYDFVHHAQKKLDEIWALGRIPIIEGGTGFYIRALVRGYNLASVPKQHDLRTRLEEVAKTQAGKIELYERLKLVDPISANRIHPNNVVRVIRALEVYYSTGVPMSMLIREAPSKIDPVFLGLTASRQTIYQRCDIRTEDQLRAGLVEEVQDFLARGYDYNVPALRGVGYSDVVRFVKGEITYEQLPDEIKKSNRNLAKRQLTWFRSEPDIAWFNIELNKVENVLAYVESAIS